MIKMFYLGWKSDIDPAEFVADMQALGLSAHIPDDGDADVVVVVANPPISDDEARAHFEGGA
jgi:hypothetical protein